MNSTGNYSGKILYISTPASGKSSDLPSGYACDRAETVEAALNLLYDQSYDLIILDDAVFADQTYLVIIELKRRKPEVPLVILTENMSSVYQTNLMDAGTDDVLCRNLSQEELQTRLNICIKRGQRNQRDYRREITLYQIMHLTQQLNTQTEPNSFIEKTVRSIRSTFMLYGCAVIIPDNGLERVYISSQAGKNQPDFSRAIREQTTTDPFVRPVFTGVIEAFQDISKDRHYRAMATLPEAHSALVIPLRQHTDSIGTLVLFGNHGQQFDLDDVSVFEILANQLAGSLQNAFFHEAQTLQVQVNKVLLNAWQLLLRAATAPEVATTLCRLIEEIPNVEHALVWLTGATREETAVYSHQNLHAARDTFSNLLKQNSVSDLVDSTHVDSGVLLQTQLSPTNPIRPLFRALNARRLLFLPLEDSARLIGGTVISIAEDKQFGLNDVALVRNLAVAAGQALERITLIEAMAEKSARLEAILRSITEGIFFVDDANRIAFCNPQATELMGIKPSEVLEKQSFVLLDLLSSRAENPEHARTSLFAAVDSINGSALQPKDNYPIVEFPLGGNRQTVRVEFIAIDEFQKWHRSWIGLIQRMDVVEQDSVPSDTVGFLVNTLSATGKELANNIDLLVNSGNKQSNTQRLARLNDIKHGVTAMRQLVQNVADYSTISPYQPDHFFAMVDLAELIRDVIRDHFPESHPALRFAPKPGQYKIEFDQQIGRRALTRLFEDCITRGQSDGVISVNLENAGSTLRIIIEQALASGRRIGELSPFDVVSHDLRLDLWKDVYPFYLLIQLFQGSISNALVSGKTQRLTISFPLPTTEELTPLPDTGELTAPDGVKAVSAPVRAPDTVMLVEGSSAISVGLKRMLESEGYDLVIPRSPSDAVSELRLVHLDLIVIDGALSDMDTVTLIQRMRRVVEVPIVVIADSASDEQRVNALNAGAEDYVVAPISDAELVARVKLLFRRKHLADRTEVPLEFGDLRIDFARRQVYVNRKPVILTRIEYDLLNVLVKNKGQVVVHQTLLESVWGPEYHTETQYLWVHISRLRKKLEPTAYIHNQARIGYVFQPD